MKRELGQFMTPSDLAELMSKLVVQKNDISKKKITVYDSSFGTANLLAATIDEISNAFEGKEIKCYGSELDKKLFKIGKAVLDDKGIYFKSKCGDALANDLFENKKYFDYICINPPMGVNFDVDVLSRDSRFEGLPVERRVDSQMLFIYDALRKLAPTGRMVAVQTASSLDMGDADSCASKIREYIFKNDLLEAIIALPDYLFEGTKIPTYIWIFNKNKSEARKGYVQLIDAIQCYSLIEDKNGKSKQISKEYAETINRVYQTLEATDNCPSVMIKNDSFGVQEIPVYVDENNKYCKKCTLDKPYWKYLRETVLKEYPNSKVDSKNIKTYYSILFNSYFDNNEKVNTVQTLKDYIQLIQGYHFKKENLSYDYSYPVVRIRDFSDKDTIDYDKCIKINDSNDIIEKYRIQTSDILIVMSGNNIGKVIYIKEDIDAHIYANQRVGILRSDYSNEIFKELVSNSFRSWLLKRINVKVVPNINASDILDYPFCLTAT